jgi:spore germination protein KC
MPAKGILTGLLLCMLLIAGCGGAKETDEVSYILTIGVDRAPDKQISVTYRIAIPQQLAGEKIGEAGKTTSLVTITAPSLAEARNLLNSAVGRSVNLSHTRAFLIGEEMARKGLGDFLGPLMRFREFRGSMYVLVVQGSAKELMEKNDPKIEILESRWVEGMMESAEASSYYLRSTLHEFYTRLKAETGAPFTALAGINSLRGEKRTAGSRTPGERTEQYEAGGMPQEGGNPASMAGSAVFKEDKMVGMLTTQETRMLAILMGKMPGSYFVIDDPLQGERSVNIRLRLGEAPRIQVNISLDRPVIHIKALLEGEITSVPSGINYEADPYQPIIESWISDIVRTDMLRMLERTQAWGTDVADFGYYIRPKFTTQEELKRYNWDQQFRRATFDVQISTKIRRTGLMRKTLPIRREES